MRPDDRVRLNHMVDAIEVAMGFARGRSRADLDTDDMLRFALVQAVQIVGEAASKVSQRTRATIPAIPWADIIGMRNRLVHSYFDINADILWSTVQQSLPALLAELKDVPLDE